MIPPGNIFLIGMPGAGKTSVGKVLAQRLGLTFIDTDREMIQRTGVSIATIFEVEGEVGFRQRETQLIMALVQGSGILMATGGGAVLAAANRNVLRQHGTVVYLHAPLSCLWERTQRDPRRPLLRNDDPYTTLKSLLETREPLYRQTAHLIVDTGRQSVAKLAETVIEHLYAASFLTQPAV